MAGTKKFKSHECSEPRDIPIKLILWAPASLPTLATPLPPYPTSFTAEMTRTFTPSTIQHNRDLNAVNSSPPLTVLVVEGSHDALFLATQSSRRQFFQNFVSSQTKQVMIRGANHAHFASYDDSKMKVNNPCWDQASISREAQQNLACKYTLQFLKSM